MDVVMQPSQQAVQTWYVSVIPSRRSVLIINPGRGPFAMEIVEKRRVVIPHQFAIRVTVNAEYWIGRTQVQDGRVKYKFEQEQTKAKSEWVSTPTCAFAQVYKRAHPEDKYANKFNGRALFGVHYESVQEILREVHKECQEFGQALNGEVVQANGEVAQANDEVVQANGEVVQANSRVARAAMPPMSPPPPPPPPPPAPLSCTMLPLLSPPPPPPPPPPAPLSCTMLRKLADVADSEISEAADLIFNKSDLEEGRKQSRSLRQQRAQTGGLQVKLVVETKKRRVQAAAD